MEFASVIRSTPDSQKPSLFELIAESQLASLLPPTLRYLLAIATHRNPRYLLRILNSFDELYALLMIIIEYRYITTYSGGFTENFYGLKREKVAAVGETARANIAAPSQVREVLALTKLDVWKNIVVMVGIPYLKRKFDESYEINSPRTLLGASYTCMPRNPTFKQRLSYYYQWFLRNLYPSINAAYYLSILIFNVSYIYDNSRYHTPFLWLIQTRIRRLSEADHQAFEALTNSRKISQTSLNRADWLLAGLKGLLPTSIFALKFLEWWHASDFSRQLSKKAAESIEFPPPVNARTSPLHTNSEVNYPDASPMRNEVQSKNVPVVTDKTPIGSTTLCPIYTVAPNLLEDSCPICLQEIVTPTACQTGFVFCYACIHRWLEGNHDKQAEFMKGKEGKWESGKGRCAVSGIRVLGGTGGLRRLRI